MTPPSSYCFHETIPYLLSKTKCFPQTPTPEKRKGGFICSDSLSPFAEKRYFTRIEFRITEMELNAIAPSAMTGWSSAAMASGMAITL